MPASAARSRGSWVSASSLAASTSYSSAAARSSGRVRIFVGLGLIVAIIKAFILFLAAKIIRLGLRRLRHNRLWLSHVEVLGMLVHRVRIVRVKWISSQVVSIEFILVALVVL